MIVEKLKDLLESTKEQVGKHNNSNDSDTIEDERELTNLTIQLDILNAEVKLATITGEYGKLDQFEIQVKRLVDKIESIRSKYA